MKVRIRGDPTIATTPMAVECVTLTLMADHVRFADRGTYANGVRGGRS
ncbi:hypothetical protein JW752_03560 [Candidatus Peregrinibacteria bacterium]|nr:hypothetical protein [Candidatus Peregrinibacteria bacterium]